MYDRNFKYETEIFCHQYLKVDNSAINKDSSANALTYIPIVTCKLQGWADVWHCNTFCLLAYYMYNDLILSPNR